MVSGFNLCGLHCRIACGEIVIIIDELAHNYKNRCSPGLNRGPLTLAVSTLPLELRPPGNSQLCGWNHVRRIDRVLFIIIVLRIIYGHTNRDRARKSVKQVKYNYTIGFA